MLDLAADWSGMVGLVGGPQPHFYEVIPVRLWFSALSCRPGLACRWVQCVFCLALLLGSDGAMLKSASITEQLAWKPYCHQDRCA